MKKSIPLLLLGGAGLVALGYFAHAAINPVRHIERTLPGGGVETVYFFGHAPVLAEAPAPVAALDPFSRDADFLAARDPFFAQDQWAEAMHRRMQAAFAAMDRQAALLDAHPLLNASAGDGARDLGGVCIHSSETRWTPKGAQTIERTYGDCKDAQSGHAGKQPAPPSAPQGGAPQNAI